MREKREQVISQHQELDHESDRLRLLCHARPEALATGRARQIIEREVRSLIEKLRQHFRYEERDGYMAGIAAEKPHLASIIHELRRDHDHMRENMAELEASSFEDGPCDAFQARVLAFLDHIHRHEQAENEVLERYMTDEYGR